MSKHNYSQYSNKPKKNGAVNPNYVPPATTPEVKMELKNEKPVTVEQVVKNEKPVTIEPAIELVQETVDTITLPETVPGTVINCAKLNVRANPSTDAAVVCVLDVASEIQVDATKSDNEWLKVCTATGIEGYCMRNFINTHL